MIKQGVDVLVFAAHPDDAELACSGTIAKLTAQGKRVAVVDLTQGELGTRGSAEIRKHEAEKSAKILNLCHRENLCLPDAWFEINQESIRVVIQSIRKLKPQIVLANALNDRHTDHGKAAELVHKACFLSGLRKIETYTNEGEPQEEWRPKTLCHYIQYDYIKPDFVVDITAQMNTKLEAIKAFDSQFYNPESKEPTSVIATKHFMDFIDGRAREMGNIIQKEFGEGFVFSRTPELDLDYFLM